MIISNVRKVLWCYFDGSILLEQICAFTTVFVLTFCTSICFSMFVTTTVHCYYLKTDPFYINIVLKIRSLYSFGKKANVKLYPKTHRYATYMGL